jgi:outer membrane murein-binding lipoprotein Lpp
LGIIATRVQESYPIVDPIVLVSAAALFFALWALFKTDREPTTAGGRARAENWAARLSRPFAVALISTAILVAGTVLVLNHLRQPQDAAMPEIRRQVESLRSEVFLLQSEVAALRAQQSVSKPTAVNTEPKKNTATRNH